MRTSALKSVSCHVLIVLLFAEAGSFCSGAEQDQFVFHDFRDALKQAREKELPMIVHFYTQWCGPCRMMDQTVFSSPELKKVLSGKIVLVKVDADRSPDLAKMYQITQYPTDVYVDPEGRVLSASSGGMPLDNYIRNAMQVAGRYQQSKRLFVARKMSGKDPSATTSFEVRLGQAAPFPRELLNPREETPGKNTLPQSQQVPDPRDLSSGKEITKSNVVFVALDGYSPVKLQEERSWVRGNKKWIVEYRQQQYWLSSKKEMELFQENPQKYAPRILGCDPVLMWESDRAIPGSTEFAAYYNDRLYLFTSEENREIFQIDPERYITTRHVLAPRFVEATLIR